MKLTAATIAVLSLPDGIDDKIFFDDDLKGFGVRLRRSGKRTLVLQYAVAGKTRKIPLGPVTELAKARATAKDLLAKVRLGGDPASEKAQARVRATETFGALLKPFLARQQSRLRRGSLVNMNRHLLKFCKPLHPLPIAAIDRRTVAARLSEIAQTSGPVSANCTRTSLSAFFSWAIKEGFLETNPVALTNKAVVNGPRTRVLTNAELALVWRALDEGPFAVIVGLLSLTGLRRLEVADLCWSEINFDTNLITLPAARTKNKRVHLVPMSAAVRKLLETQPRRPGRDRVFPFINWDVFKTRLDRRCAEIAGAPLEGWVLHDLRRTLSTRLHELGTQPHIVEVLLGHVGHQGGVAGVYNHASYLLESRRALDRWADHVLALVNGEKTTAEVVPLRSA